MTKRESLLLLLDLYKKGKYDIDTFCEQLTTILYYERSAIYELNDYERKCFKSLADVAERYSPFEEDYKLHPNAFKTKDDVIKAINNAYLLLVEKNF